jgi:hypothetical protein
MGVNEDLTNEEKFIVQQQEKINNLEKEIERLKVMIFHFTGKME